MKHALALTALAFLASTARAQSTAEYQVRFQSTWSLTNFPDAWPPNPHFSALIGGTHSGAIAFWEPGGIASNGIEFMAETGGISPLRDEVIAQINAGNAGEVVQGPGIGTPQMTTTTFTTTEEFSRVTLVTMVAPSPDWFVGVGGLELFAGGAWVETLTVPLHVWDAGTDSGSDFTSSNADLTPHEPIALLSGGPFFLGDSLGTFTFTRLDGSGEFSSTCSGNGGNLAGCTACPCGNDAPVGTIGGCLNSAGTSGRLLVSGTSSIAASDLRFTMEGLVPAATTVLVSGAAIAPTNPSNPCAGQDSGVTGVAFDGLRCAVQSVRRHGTRVSFSDGTIGGDTAGFGPPDGPPGGIAASAGFTAGQTRHFQGITRDVDALVCQTGQNSTQAVTVTFRP